MLNKTKEHLILDVLILGSGIFGTIFYMKIFPDYNGLIASMVLIILALAFLILFKKLNKENNSSTPHLIGGIIGSATLGIIFIILFNLSFLIYSFAMWDCAIYFTLVIYHRKSKEI